jgi:uncharacterized membrane protein
MTLYELLLALHIVAAIIWLGAGFLVAVLVFGAERAGDRMKEASHHQDVAWLAPRLFIPASLATLLLGIAVTAEGSWDFDQLWIVLALAGWAVSFGLGFFYFRPEGERIGELVERHGPDYPEVDRRIRRLNVVDRVQVAILFLVVLDMVLKPTGDDPGLLIAGAVLLAIAVLAGVSAVGRRASPTTA